VSYELINAAMLDVLASSDQVVQMAIVRTSMMSQAASANETAWRAAKQQALDAGLTVDQAEAEADKAVPRITPEQTEAIASGNSSGADIAGNEPEARLGDEQVDVLLKYGARLMNPDLPSGQQVGEDEMTMPDPSDHSAIPRQIIIPMDMAPNQITEIVDVFGGLDQEEEEWEPYVSSWYSKEEADPYIRTPAGYRTELTEGDAAAFSRRFGGTLTDEAAKTGASRGDHMDQAEIDFINRAQGGARPGEFDRTYDEQGGSVYYEGRDQQNIIDLPGAIGPTYRESDVLDMISGMSTVQIIEFQTLAGDAGFYGSNKRPDINGYMSGDDQAILATVMGQANVSGETVWPMMELFAESGRANATGAAARVKEPFSVPAHLRSIPGEKTVAEEVKLRFRQKMGREARPDELGGIADELTGYYTKSNQEEIALYLAAYNGDNQGLLTGAQMQRIEEPGAATSFDIADKWANEIDLNKRRETNSDSFSRMLSATMGNRPSVGNLTAAGGVAQIGRQ